MVENIAMTTQKRNTQKKNTKQRKKRQKRTFSGMGYREVQRANRNRRAQLPKPQQRELKAQGYKNVGWDNVIALYQKINDLLLQGDPQEDSLEALFLKADRIGNKYQTAAEIDDFNQKLAAEAHAIADEIDRQFPEPETEFIDYSQPKNKAKSPAKTRRR